MREAYNRPVRRLAPYLICLALAIPVALVATEVIQYSRNSLLENGRWVSVKPMMQIRILGARHFVFTRRALNRNRLDLSTWFGFHEVYLNRLLRLGSVEFDFRLDEGAHLTSVVGRTPKGFLGVRFSRHETFPTMLFRADRAGAFEETRPVGGIDLDHQWHRARLAFIDGLLEISLDGIRVASFEAADSGDQIIGFRGGLERTEVDNVIVRDAEERLLLKEGFRNRRGAWGVLATAVAILWLLLLGVRQLASRRERQSGDVRPEYWVGLTAFVLSVLAALFLVFDLYVWSSGYYYDLAGPVPAEWAGATRHRLETLRQRVFGIEVRHRTRPSRSAPELVGPLKRVRRSLTKWDLVTPYHPAPVAYSSAAPGSPRQVEESRILEVAAAETIRIAFIGTSQTAGVGAEVLTDTLVARIHRQLSTRIPSDIELWVVNFAIPGSSSGPLLTSYTERWAALQPDLLVAILSFNDRDLKTFDVNMRAFVEFIDSKGAQILLVLEPAFLNKSKRAPLSQRHDVLRSIGRSMETPVLDLQAYMDDPAVYDSGFLWWDRVHMTSYAQDLAATWLTDQILPYLEAVLAERELDPF